MAARKKIAPEIPDVSVEPRWPHQDETIAFGLEHDRFMDTSDPGTGKTRAHIEIIVERRKRGLGKRVLVLSPMTLMDSAWGVDIQKYAPSLTVSYAYAEQREEAFTMKTDVVVMNHDGVKWFTDKKFPKRRKLLEAFDTIVIDEWTVFKHNSARTKALHKLRNFFKYRQQLSGTPNPNSVMELFYPALFADNGKRLGTSYYGLRAAVQIPEQTGPEANHLTWHDKPGATQVVNELLADITIRHAFADVMKHVPPNYRHTKQFDLSPKARKIYLQLEEEAVAKFDSGERIDAVHAAALRTKLLQVASGAVYSGEDKYVLVDRTRYIMISDLIEEREHSIVFFNWAHQRDEMFKELKSRKISYALIDGTVDRRDRPQIVREYQAGKYQTLLLHPRTGAHGLTLTRGLSTIFSSPIYEADLMEQGIARIVRGTQNRETETLFIEARGTVEKDVYEKLNNKAANMQDLLAQMRDRTKDRSKRK